MNDSSSVGRLLIFRNLRIRLIGIVLLLLSVFGLLVAWNTGAFMGPRPMFCNSSAMGRGLAPIWMSDGSFYASDHSVAFVDSELNIIVVMASGVYDGYRSADSEGASILVNGGRLEIKSSTTNTMFLVRSASDFEVVDIPLNSARTTLEAFGRTGRSAQDGGESVWTVVADALAEDSLRSRLETFKSRP